jgi:hypothetical protein
MVSQILNERIWIVNNNYDFNYEMCRCISATRFRREEVAQSDRGSVLGDKSGNHVFLTTPLQF